MILIVDRRESTDIGAELNVHGAVWLISALVNDRLELRINGVAFAPAELRHDGAYLYSISRVPASTLTLRVLPPRVIDFAEPSPEVIVQRVAVIAPDSLFAPRDGWIEIAVSGLSQYPVGGSNGSWWLEVHLDDCRHTQVLSLSGNAVPPPMRKFPMTLLPEGLHVGYVEVRGQLLRATQSPGGSYQILVSSAFGACIPFRVLQ